LIKSPSDEGLLIVLRGKQFDYLEPQSVQEQSTYEEKVQDELIFVKMQRK
jgi:hypothetical protein